MSDYKFSLIVCTYMRPIPLVKLLNSVKAQSLYPDEILIIDGSRDTKTELALKENVFKNLNYYKVDDADRGLTKQRNFGISKASNESNILCFLDDDIVLTEHYFKELIGSYTEKPEALAIGGYILNEAEWQPTSQDNNIASEFYFDGWMRAEPSRFRLRKVFGLEPDTAPGFLPTFAHGRSVGFLPPSDKIYEVEQIMGGVSSYKKAVFESLSFSTFFEGYGLYEDADFSLRISKLGKLYVNTRAQLYHYHDFSGRPNKYKYGKMVMRNGWYVWRVKYPKPKLKHRIKWNATALLLMSIRATNIINTNKRKEAFTESLGRLVGWISIIFAKPKIGQ